MAMTLTVALLGGAGMCFLASPQRQQGQPLLALRAGEQIAQVPRSAKRETAEAIEIHGRVLDPDGKPVSGAKLFELRGTSGASPTSPDTRPNVVGTTDAEGRFRIMIRRPDSAVQTYLVGHAAGFGVDWIDLSESRRQAEVMLRLPKDVPITGRIVNTEGRPVAGASVSIADIYTPANEKLDDYLKSGAVNFFQKLFYRETPKQLRVPLDGITGKTATDKDGRFRIRGAGRERIARVSISGGGGVVRSRLWVITRPGFDPKPYNAEQQKGAGAAGMASEYFLYPPALEFIAEAGNAIEGTVKDAASGEPIPGCRMSVWQWGQRGDTVVADVVSGARGEYRLDGLSKNDTVLVRPPKGSVYLSRRVEVANTARQTKVKLDIELSKGVIVVGRVVDKQTGKGVQGNIGFSPLAGNRFYGTKPGFDQRGYDYEETDKDGRFRRVTIPGKSLVKFWVDHQTERLNSQDLSVYRRAAPDPDHKDLFQPVDPERSPNRWYVRTADGNVEQIFGMYSAVKVIDVKEDDETRVELSVDRGVTARIAVQDAGGKPLAGAWASGLTDHPPWLTTFKLPDATATVYALNPDKPREMAFFHVERKLGGTATVRGDENEPVVVKLAPLGQVFGRVFDADGNPLTGVEVSIRAETESGSELYHVAAPPSGKPVRADKDGRFHIEGVVPGLKFTLLLQAKAPIFGGFKGAAVRQVQVKSGEKLDLGDVRVKLGS
jgi:protocatechuate 3,4-dioxygenase beta subunit